MCHKGINIITIQVAILSSLLLPSLSGGGQYNQDVDQFFQIHDCNYLIVFPDSFVTQAIDLATYRAQNGFEVSIASWDSIQSYYNYQNADSSLYEFIQTIWDSSTIQLQYLVLMGDWEIIPTHQSFYAGYDSVLYDNWYTQLDSVSQITNIPLFSLGRIPVETSLQLDWYIDRIIMYETGMQIIPWQNRVVGIAGAEPSSTLPECYFDTQLLSFSDDFANSNLEYLFNSMCEESDYYIPGNPQIQPMFTEGSVITLYSGHSSNSQWDVDSLITFDNVSSFQFWEYSPIIVSSALKQLAFRDTMSSIAKKLTIQSKYGPVAILSSSGMVTYTSNTLFFESVVNYLIDDDYETIGNVMVASKKNMDGTIGSFIQLFGDPALIPQLIRNEVDIREPLSLDISINQQSEFVSMFPQSTWSYVEFPLLHYPLIFQDSSASVQQVRLNLFPDGVNQFVVIGNLYIDNIRLSDSIIIDFEDGLDNWYITSGINSLSFGLSNDTPYGLGNSLKLTFENSNGDTNRSYAYLQFEPLIELTRNDTISFWIKKGDVYMGTSQPSIDLPGNYLLYEPFPNPFNLTTTVKFSIPLNSVVGIYIYDLLGRKIDTVLYEFMTAGDYSVKWDGRNYSSGVYFIKLESNNISRTKKFLLIK